MNIWRMCATLVLATATAMAVQTAGAKDRPEPEKPIELKAVGGAKEVPVNREVTGCRIEVTEGTVVINTVVVREGPEKTSLTVGRKLTTEDHLDLPFGSKRMITGLRISDGGGGTYRVYVHAEPPPGAKRPSRESGPPSTPRSR